MAKLINIGFGNVVNSQKIVAVVSPDAAPVKRMVQSIKGTRSLIDATQGRKTKAVIVTSDDYLVLSALQPETIARRFAEIYDNFLSAISLISLFFSIIFILIYSFFDNCFTKIGECVVNIICTFFDIYSK